MSLNIDITYFTTCMDFAIFVVFANRPHSFFFYLIAVVTYAQLHCNRSSDSDGKLDVIEVQTYLLKPLRRLVSESNNAVDLFAVILV